MVFKTLSLSRGVCVEREEKGSRSPLLFRGCEMRNEQEVGGPSFW